jgi:Cupredoxin-like domain
LTKGGGFNYENHSQFQKGGHAMLRKPTLGKGLLVAIVSATALALVTASFADDDGIAQLRFQHGSFAPTQLSVPANRPFKVKVTNGSDSAIEFESFELHRERVVAPGETITVHMPSLAPGSYQFFDDFHHEVPKGLIVSQ